MRQPHRAGVNRVGGEQLAFGDAAEGALMCHRGCTVCSMVVAAILSIGIGARAAALDITGTWVVEYAFISPPEVWSFVQSGEQLTVTVPSGLSFSGTLDPTRGAIHIDFGPSIPQFPDLCPHNSLEGVVIANGNGLRGIGATYAGAMCRPFANPVTASRCGINTPNPFCVPPVCGNGAVEGVEQCDDANTVDGDGCDAHCLLECQNPVAEATIVFGRLGTVHDTLTFRGTLTLPAPFNPPLSLMNNGLRLVINDATGPVLDVAIPGGAQSNARRTGWKVNKRGTTWTYVAASADRMSGIFQIVVQDKSSLAPGRVTFVVKGRKGGSSFLSGADIALKGLVFFNLADGQCGEATFPGPAPMPQCTFNASGRTLTCK